MVGVGGRGALIQVLYLVVGKTWDEPIPHIYQDGVLLLIVYQVYHTNHAYCMLSYRTCAGTRIMLAWISELSHRKKRIYVLLYPSSRRIT